MHRKNLLTENANFGMIEARNSRGLTEKNPRKEMQIILEKG